MKNQKENILTFIPQDQKTIFVPKIKKTELNYIELISILIGIIVINFGILYGIKEFTLIRDISNLKSEIVNIDSKSQGIYPSEGIVETIRGYSNLINSQYKLNKSINDIQKKIQSGSKIKSISYIKDTKILELELEVADIGIINKQLEEFRKSEYVSNVSYQDIGIENDRNSTGSISTKFNLTLQ